MAKISILPPHEAQKIAAGEVVERPANVVKELIENSLDAGATEVTLYIEDGGKQLMRIVDNGSGMSPEDARLCIEHHATSKLRSIQDLERTVTFGFRGEALSSIAAVSAMQITTKEYDAQAATMLDIHEGTIAQEKLIGANTGTDISIKHLFFNVPARQKFLKTKETEWRAIAQLIQAIALAHETVSFKLHHNGKLIINAPGTTSIAERMAQLFEPALASKIMLLNHRIDRMALTVTGALSSPEYTRFDRSSIYVFVNKRWVKNHKLVQAFIKGYQQMLQPGKYPAGCLFITLDPQYVDINVHPRKEEVQFLHPRIVEELIEKAVREALENRHSNAKAAAALLESPEIPLVPSDPRSGLYRGMPKKLIFKTQNSANDMRKESIPSLQEDAIVQHAQTLQESEQPQAIEPKEEKKAVEAFRPARVEPDFEQLTAFAQTHDQQEPYAILGQFNCTYIMLETANGLAFIDQHAAHERIIYEKLRSRFEETARVRLLFPQVIGLSQEDCSLIEPYLELLLTFGVEAQRISPTQITITQTPLFLKNQSLEETIKQAIGVLHEHEYLNKDELKNLINKKIHAQLSCAAAVKAGDELSFEGMAELIRDLFICPNKLTCPHGRPTKWELTINDIEKKFKRDYR